MMTWQQCSRLRRNTLDRQALRSKGNTISRRRRSHDRRRQTLYGTNADDGCSYWFVPWCTEATSSYRPAVSLTRSSVDTANTALRISSFLLSLARITRRSLLPGVGLARPTIAHATSTQQSTKTQLPAREMPTRNGTLSLSATSLSLVDGEASVDCDQSIGTTVVDAAECRGVGDNVAVAGRLERVASRTGVGALEMLMTMIAGVRGAGVGRSDVGSVRTVGGGGGGGGGGGVAKGVGC